MTPAQPSSELPPRPDPETGQPRPPHAPVYRGDDRYNEDSRERHVRYKPAPPPEQGPVLAWYQSSKKNALAIFFFTLVMMVVGMSVIVWLKGDSPIAWMKYWFIWLVVIAAPVLVTSTVRGKKCSAGAEWLQHGRTWVRLYELTHVSFRRYAYDVELHLTDRDKRKVEVDIELLQQDRLIWDLVYNGILHSAADGATVNPAAERTLQLPSFTSTNTATVEDDLHAERPVRRTERP